MKRILKTTMSVILVVATVVLLSMAAFAEYYSVLSLDEYKGFQFSFRGNGSADGSENYFGITEGKTARVEGNVWFDIDPQTSPHYITSVVQLCHKGGLFGLSTVVDLTVNLYPGNLGNTSNTTVSSLVYSNSDSVFIDETADYYVTVSTSGVDNAYYSTYIVNVNY